MPIPTSSQIVCETIIAVRQIGLRVDDDLHAWLSELAQREHRTLNGQIVHALERYRAEHDAKRRRHTDEPES